MLSIKDNFDHIQAQIDEAAVSCGRNPGDITLIAVSKRKSAENILECIQAGCKHFGENYIQEAMKKIDRIGKDKACWHFIGHLQSNKAKFAVPYFDYIHTVDSVKLAKEINKQALKNKKIQNIFIQINISEESTKSGTGKEQIFDLVRNICVFENMSIQGLMCMPPYFSDPEDARIFFQQLVEIKNQILDLNIENVAMDHLSMGMSNDFKVAIEEGSTMVRVGTSIFGRRD